MTALHVITEPSAPGPAVEPGASRLRMADLPTAERLMLRALRLMAESQDNWSMVQQELWLNLGLATIEPVLQGLENFLATLSLSSRRPLAIRTPVARRVHSDEHSILGLIAAIQADQPDRAAAHARWLVRSGAQPLLLRHGAALAEALSLGDLRLGRSASAPAHTAATAESHVALDA